MWLRRAVVVAWIVAGTAVLLVVLSRLFAAAVPVPDAGAGVGTPGSGGGGGYYQYVYPRARIGQLGGGQGVYPVYPGQGGQVP